MMRSLLAAAVLLGAALASAPPPPHPIGDAVAVVTGKAEFRLRFRLAEERKPCEAAWEAFLDRTCDHFDRDGDGWLSRAEAGRLFAFPLPGRRGLVVDFDRLDADGDGKGTREELRAFCRRGGFTPLVLRVEPTTAEDQRLAIVLARHLGVDDGKMTSTALSRAPALLDRFDANEDEALVPAELLTLPTPSRRSRGGRVKPSSAAVPDATIRVDFSAKRPQVTVEGQQAKRLRLTKPVAATQPHRLDGPAGEWSMSILAWRAAANVRQSNEFVLAQLEAALDGRPSLTRAEVEADATLTGLLDLFSFADRDGDGRLAPAELRTYLELIRLGTEAQTWVTLCERGQSLFHLLDADSDGRLSYAELARAGRAHGAGPIPWQVQVSFGGPAVSVWGGVPLPAVARLRPTAFSAKNDAPRWFQAMDRNKDGVLSPKEFVGSPESFRRLDVDGDGAISADEASERHSSTPGVGGEGDR